MNKSKAYKEAKKQIPENPVNVQEAVQAVKKYAHAKFDETIEVHIHLGVDAGKSDQMVRGSVVLPHGTPSKKNIVVFVNDAKAQEEAKQAGATIAGGEDLIDEIEEKGSLDADVTVATPDMMQKIAKIAKILGPKGLMPSPKTGTVTTDTAQTVKELATGTVSYRMDQTGNVHEAIGKVSWDDEKITENLATFIENVKSARPQTQKGEFIKTIAVKSTMGPSVRVS